MSGYQSIPSASVECMETGASYPPADGSTPSHAPTPSAPSSAVKLAYLSLGIIAGCLGSNWLLRWGPPPSKSAHDVSTIATPSAAIVNGKSFLDSLPFEEVLPSSWNPAQPRPHEEGLPRMSKALSSSILSSIASSVSSSTSSASSSSSSPHLLYHAHQSAFGLLYDPSKSSNNYLSEYSLDYFLLNSGGFDAQINQAYCAAATVAAVLNSLKYAKRFREGDDLSGWSFDLPVDPRYDPYPYATQKDILAGDCVWKNVIEIGGSGGDAGDVNGIFKPPYGLNMAQAGELLRCHTSEDSEDWDVVVHEVDPAKATVGQMRFDLKTALIDPDARVLINYDRKILGQVGGGHFSPIGAYSPSTDSFLVVDVAKYKYPPVWVAASTLFASLATVDQCGTYDFPQGQERLNDNNTSDGKSSKLFSPITPEEYAESLQVLNCEQSYRGYIVLKKKATNSQG
ncbi:hypothetical protein ACHAXT_002320 [Thalassiosira profunda]